MKKFVNFLVKLGSSRRFQAVVAFLVMGTIGVFAQGYDAGITAMDDVTTQVAKYVPVISKLCYAIAAVVAIVGAISVYIDMNNDSQDVKKKIMMLVGACIFLIAAATALPKFFGHSSDSGATGLNSTNVIMIEQLPSITITELAA